MGLDSVELVMEFEEEFGIEIPDADAERLYTIGAVIRYIAARQGLQASLGCPTAGAFYAFRRALIQEFGIAREAVKPQARVLTLVDRSQRKALDERLLAMGVDITAVRGHYDPGSVFIAVASLGTALIGLTAIVSGLQSKTSAAAIILMTAVALIVALAVRRKYWTSAARVRDIIHSLAVTNYSVTSRDEARIQDIRDRVCTIVSEQLGVNRTELSDSTSFVRDLNVG